MQILFLSLVISCEEPKMINKTKFPWNDFDMKIKTTCTKRCTTLYDDAPCLKQFIKFGKQDYHCICGN